MKLKASEILDNMYKRATMEVPSEKEKQTMHIPETHIDKPVSQEKKLLDIAKKCR